MYTYEGKKYPSQDEAIPVAQGDAMKKADRLRELAKQDDPNISNADLSGIRAASSAIEGEGVKFRVYSDGEQESLL